MKTLIRFIQTPADRRSGRELRDEIRRINLARFGRDVDGEADPKMDGRTLGAWDRDRLAATIDLHLGSDEPIPKEKLSHHKVHEVCPKAPPTSVAVLDEAIIHPDFGFQPVGVELHEAAGRFALRKGAQWLFSTCHPTEIGVYAALGFRACGSPLISRTHGEHVPTVVDLGDVEQLRRVRSPFAELAAQAPRAAAQPVAEPEPEPLLEKLDSMAVWRQIYELQRQARQSGAAFLTDIRDTEIGRLMLGSSVLQPMRGQRLIKQGDADRDMFLILTGQVSVEYDGRQVAMLAAGDVVGEIGLVLDTPRTTDVIAATDDTTCLRLTEARLQELMSKEPALAARITLGIAKALCLKLIRTTGVGRSSA